MGATVKAIRIQEGEKSHSFSIGENIVIMAEVGKIGKHEYGNENLSKCWNGKVYQYLWFDEINRN